MHQTLSDGLQAFAAAAENFLGYDAHGLLKRRVQEGGLLEGVCELDEREIG